MGKVAATVFALGVSAFASGGVSNAQSWGAPYYTGPYYGAPPPGAPAYGAYAYPPRSAYGREGWNARPQPRYAPPRETRREVGADLAQEVLAEINRVRADPQRYARELRAYRDRYDGDVVREPGDEIGVRTNEGVAAVDGAIAELERRAPVGPLGHNPRLAASAARLAEAQGPTGAVGHVGPDGLTPSHRMRAEGLYAGISEENISYGASTAKAVVRQLIIDDGVPSRGHRQSLFEAGLSHAGVSCGPHAQYGYMCVIDLAGALATR
jgi:uncharacterized protein YkwD